MDKRNSNNSTVKRVVRTTPKNNKSKKTQTKGVTVAKLIGKVFLMIALVFTITCCIVGTVMTIYVLKYIDSEPAVDIANLELSYTTTIYGVNDDGDYEEVRRIRRGEDRIWVDLEEVPEYLQKAVVYTEDEHFYEHDGVDFQRTFAAVLNEFANILFGENNDRFGGSTITQQLIKNINGDIANRSIDVKIREIMEAMNVERHFTKEQILEGYLNYIGLGNGVSGVQAGAKYYFNKDVSELTLNECASIAIISKNPSTINPKDGPERNNERRQYALRQLLDNNVITQAEYDEVYDTPVTVASVNKIDTEEDDISLTSGVQDYFIDALIEEVIADLQAEYNYSYKEAENKLYTSGWQIYSTMNISAQKTLDSFFADIDNIRLEGTSISNEDMPQASMVIMDYSGNVVALVGGSGEKTETRGFNLATQAVRSFGSTIKPLSVYTPAFESDLINWSSILIDEATTTLTENGVSRKWPKNYNNVYEGNYSVIDAIKVSKNTIPVSLCNSLTAQVCYNFMVDKLHFGDLSNNNINAASMALGDAGTTLVDLVNAYQIFGNNGYFTDHKMYSKITDLSNKSILDVSKRETSQVITSQTAYVMNRALCEVVTGSSGGGWRARSSTYETFGKTGTENENRDVLFMGGNPYYVAGIRYGYNDNSELPSTFSGAKTARVWKAVMDKVLQGKAAAKFDLDSDDVVQLKYCKKTGKVANSTCPSTGTGYYKKSNIPTVCSEH